MSDISEITRPRRAGEVTNPCVHPHVPITREIDRILRRALLNSVTVIKVLERP